MNLVHLAPDDKFIPFVQKTFELAFPGRNRFRISPSDSTLQFAVPGSNVAAVRSAYWFSEALKEDLRWCDCLVIHYMLPWFRRAIVEAPLSVTVLWSAWGGDFYDFVPGFGGSMYLPQTRALMSQLPKRSEWHPKAAAHRMFQCAFGMLLPRWDHGVISRIDAVSTVIPPEYKLLAASQPGFRARHHQLYYGSVEDTFMKGPDRLQGDDILVGNSATATNNHAEALALLSRSRLGSRRIVVPLSYGDARYAEAICRLGAELFGERFLPLRDFLPLDQYSAAIARCSAVVMNHVRQQAVGTINAALYKGAKVFLRPENPLLAYYRELGLRVEEMPDEGFAENRLQRLPEAEVAANRRILQSAFGFERAVAAARDLRFLVAERRGAAPVDQSFDHGAGATTLRGRAIAGVRWTSVASLANIGLQILQVVILARLLAPADFGVMAVVLAIIGFLGLAADLGVSKALIHRRDARPAERSSLYWLNVMAGAALALVMFVVSPLVASIYGEPALQPLIAFAGLHLLVASTWQQLRVLAEKDLQFGSVVSVEIAGSAVGAGAAVAIAWWGGGVYALIGGLLAGSFTSAILAWPVLSRGWKPQAALRLREISDYVRFGSYVVANDIVNSVTAQIDVLLGARVMGAQAIGFYTMSRNLCLQIAGTINPVVTRVGLPVMARAQEDAKLLRSVYLQTLRMTASANFPLYLALWLFAPEIVHLLLGPQWDAAVPALRILAWWGLLRSVVNPVGSLLMACGKADLNFRWNLAWLFILPPVVWAASAYGPEALAAALTGLLVLGFVPTWYFLVRPLCHATLGEYTRQLAVPLGLSALAGALAYAIALPFTHDAARLALGLAGGGLAYGVLSVYFNGAWLRAVLEVVAFKA